MRGASRIPCGVRRLGHEGVAVRLHFLTAAGLAVAIPAVLAYNLYGKWVAACEAELEGFAHDLREMITDAAAADAAAA